MCMHDLCDQAQQSSFHYRAYNSILPQGGRVPKGTLKVCYTAIMLTPWHKTFHILVFGSLIVLILGAIVFKKEYQLQFTSGNNETYETEPQQSLGADSESIILGGSTPEDTFTLFLEALKSGDVELASRYFVAPRQAAWQEGLQQIKNGGGLEAMHKELTAISTAWKKEDRGQAVSFSAPGAQRITFVRDDHAHIWSIDEL